MTKQIYRSSLKLFACIIFISAIISCNSNNRTETKDGSMVISEHEIIPDSIVRFLINSASIDFRNQKPPTAIDFRHVKIGYLNLPNNERTYILCGEFLSRENKEWAEFTTIKTSGYEQYIGKTHYCQDATMILTDQYLSVELRNKLAE